MAPSLRRVAGLSGTAHSDVLLNLAGLENASDALMKAALLRADGFEDDGTSPAGGDLRVPTGDAGSALLSS
jgi:hypothetical protein